MNRRVLSWGTAAAICLGCLALVVVLSRDSGESEDQQSAGPIGPKSFEGRCSKFTSRDGGDDNPGTAARPYATVEQLANSLQPGQTGCIRPGVYEGDVEIGRGGTAGAPTRITGLPAGRATVRGRLYVTDGANNVVVQRLALDGRNRANLPSPTVNGDNVVFRDNDVTTRDTTICFLLGSDEYGRARGTVIERNAIHNCGKLPPTNHHHGIYVEASDGARIVGNWIYDNADRGVQLFPDAQDTYVARNVIDGNGQGVLFSGRSAGNVVEQNVISNPVLRFNLESYETTGSGNVARRNCLWSNRHRDNSGIQPDIAVAVRGNVATEPQYVDRAAKDFRVRPGNPMCRTGVAPAGR